MRRMALALAVVAAITASSAMLPCGNDALAQAGCCMQRSSLDAAWRPLRGVPLQECRGRNERDRDNVFDESGLVWWNVRCRL